MVGIGGGGICVSKGHRGRMAVAGCARIMGHLISTVIFPVAPVIFRGVAGTSGFFLVGLVGHFRRVGADYWGGGFSAGFRFWLRRHDDGGLDRGRLWRCGHYLANPGPVVVTAGSV